MTEKNQPLWEGEAQQLAELFKIFGDPTRIKLLFELLSSESCVGDLALALDMSQSAVSHQLRLLRQMDNAAKLAKALAQHPCVEKVYHPSIPTFSGYETAKRLFECDSRMVAMMSIVINTEDYDKRNEFTKHLKIAHYAATLGGVRTTYQQPIYSSQAHMPDAERRKIGITPAMFRISVGIENADDLIADFTSALNAIQ